MSPSEQETHTTIFIARISSFLLTLMNTDSGDTFMLEVIWVTFCVRFSCLLFPMLYTILLEERNTLLTACTNYNKGKGRISLQIEGGPGTAV